MQESKQQQLTEKSPPKRTNGHGRRIPAVPLFFNRELSWLEFNARVLAEAQNPSNPLLERVKFLCIFSNNLDEFFMIYVPGMRERSDDSGRPLTETQVSLRLREIQSKLTPLLEQQYRCFHELMPQLAEHGVRLLTYAELTPTQEQWVAKYFEDEVFPVLTPLAVDPGHPFPYISNLSLSLAVQVHDPYTGKDHFARVKVPSRPILPRLVPIPGEKWHFILQEEIVAAHLPRLFPGMKITASYPFRVTRNADLELEENTTDDLMELIEEQLTQRRFGAVERLEITPSLPDGLRKTLVDELEQVDEEEIYILDGPLNLADLFPLADIGIPELRDPPFVPGTPPALRHESDIFRAIRHSDIMLHHPYQSFDYVTQFIRQAADDPNVLTIKHTLYRTSGDSPILEALIDAADNGKQVACLVELKARFDEANNINWAKQLEKAGVHVVYGLLGLKTHSKVTLVIRREDEGLRRYLHIGTGNYNPKTASIYTDISLLTCEPDFGADATDLFNFLTGYSRQEEYRQFLVAPVTLRSRMMAMIERETTRHSPSNPGRIIAKMNSLVDPAIIRALYAASQKGVQIDLIVRGMCCLRPGVPNLSENIRVISIVGRFLEHSRIFYFRNGGDEEVYIGSADWMSRNLDRRVEVVVPVLSEPLRNHIKDGILRVQLTDNCQAWELQSDGTYVRRLPAAEMPRLCSQSVLLETLRA
jgi:polyphosphate kinase